MLEIRNLHASVDGAEILRGINLTVRPGEVHAIMGPNGSGKSTLAKVLAGHEDYEVTDGEVSFQGKDLMELAPEERAGEGVFLAFQYPVEIPGVKNFYFMHAAYNAIQKYREQDELKAPAFMKLARARLKEMDLKEDLLKRPVNFGFSGGEKKRNEIMQMALLDPTLAMLDETDSGLDIDALKIVADGVNSFKGANKGVILVTHYQRLLDHIVPDYVHVLVDGRLVKSGDKNLALELEEKGYDWIKEEIAQAQA